MKNIIVNTLILILMFNIIMIIFPEGKTQKFCRITIKLFIMIYILDNILLDDKMLRDYSYEREVSINGVDRSFIDSINKNSFEGDDVVKDITLSFTEEMDVRATVTLNKLLSMDEINELKTDIAEIFKISSDNIYIQ